MNDFTDLLQHMSEAPLDQIHPSITPRFAALAQADTNPSPEVLQDIHDECESKGLASPFALFAMETIIEMVTPNGVV